MKHLLQIVPLSSRFRPVSAAISIIALSLFGSATAVLATPPTVVANEVPTIIVPASRTGCQFPQDVRIDALNNKEKATTFYSGKPLLTLVTGSLTARVTRVGTTKFVDLNVPGPYKVAPQPDGTTSVITMGPTLYTFEPYVALGLPRLSFIHGYTESYFDPAGSFHFVKINGTVEDICTYLN